MKLGVRHVAVLAVLALLTGGPASGEDLQIDATSGLHYLEIVTGGAAADAPLPVVVGIHGLGDNPESFKLLLDDLPARARVIIPRGPMPHGADGYAWFDFHDADDGDGAREQADGIRQSAERLAQLVGSLAKKHGGPSRSVVCGFSQGGILSFAVAAAHPELVAVAVPVAGYLPPALWPAERPKTRPLPTVISLNGEADPLVSVESARWTVEALRSNGFDTTLKTWPGVRHAMVPDIRSTLMTSVVAAVESLSPAGTVLEGPPVAAPIPGLEKGAPHEVGGEDLPQLDVPSPLGDEHP